MGPGTPDGEYQDGDYISFYTGDRGLRPRCVRASDWSGLAEDAKCRSVKVAAQAAPVTSLFSIVSLSFGFSVGP